MAKMTGSDCAVMCKLINIHTHLHPWHRMTRMTGLDCAVVCNLINTHTHKHTHIKVLTDLGVSDWFQYRQAELFSDRGESTDVTLRHAWHGCETLPLSRRLDLSIVIRRPFVF